MSTPRASVGLGWLLGLASACADPASESPAETSTSGDPTGTSTQTDGTSDEGVDSTAAEPPPPSACAEPTEVIGAPTNLTEAVSFINALPRPLPLDCVLQQLERPLAVSATVSTISLQPAVGTRSPRVFIFSGDLIMSVAVSGDGRALLEFGELVSETQSIKAELEFPLEDPVSEADATAEVLDPDTTGTKCRLCHGFESPSDAYPMAFVSDALTFPDADRFELSQMHEERAICDATAEPERCARLDALLGFGPVVDAEFPETIQTIFDYE